MTRENSGSPHFAARFDTTYGQHATIPKVNPLASDLGYREATVILEGDKKRFVVSCRYLILDFRHDHRADNFASSFKNAQISLSASAPLHNHIQTRGSTANLKASQPVTPKPASTTTNLVLLRSLRLGLKHYGSSKTVDANLQPRKS